jgi:hypothetical protein
MAVVACLNHGRSEKCAHPCCCDMRCKHKAVKFVDDNHSIRVFKLVDGESSSVQSSFFCRYKL